MSSETKRCKCCNTVRTLDSFYDHPQMADGKLNKCKDCVISRTKTYRELNLSHVRTLEAKRYYEKGRNEEKTREQRRRYAMSGKRRVNAEKWAANNPSKIHAQVTANNAVKYKKLTRKPCERCGAVKAQKHHPDYSKPLDVVWLCPKCHGVEHRRYA